MIDLDALRLATALAHTVPGVVLELECGNGDTLAVAHRRLDAHLDPCQLRSAVLASQRTGVPRLGELVAGVRVSGGLEDLGGGLHRRRSDHGEERWFATLLGAPDVTEEFEQFPSDVPDAAIDVRLHPDADLGATAVRMVAADAAHAHRLDEVGFRALALCMVAETVRAVLRVPGRR